MLLAPLAALSVAYGIVQGLLAGASAWTPRHSPIRCCWPSSNALALARYATLGPYLALRQR